MVLTLDACYLCMDAHCHSGRECLSTMSPVTAVLGEVLLGPDRAILFSVFGIVVVEVERG